MRFRESIERNLDTGVFERLWALTGIKEDQNHLTLFDGQTRILVNNCQLHNFSKESRSRTIQITRNGVCIYMIRNQSPLVRDYLGDVWASKEDWCAIKYSGTSETNSAFKKMTAPQFEQFLLLVEKRIKQVAEASPAVEEERNKAALEKLMSNV